MNQVCLKTLIYNYKWIKSTCHSLMKEIVNVGKLLWYKALEDLTYWFFK